MKKILSPLFFTVMMSACMQGSLLNESTEFEARPIYATYAAALDASQYLVDQGYSLQFSNPELPLAFVSQKGGELGLVFAVNGRLIDAVGNYFLPPQIEESFPNMVSLTSIPSEGLEVKADFLVYSSSIVLQRYEMLNTSQDSLKFSLIPSFETDYLSIRDVAVFSDGFGFKHEKHPDSWSLNHGIPYKDSLQSVLVFSENLRDWSLLNARSGGMSTPDFVTSTGSKSEIQAYGRAYDRGERLMDSRGNAKLLLRESGNPVRIWTENSPSMVGNVPVIDQDGVIRISLDDLRHKTSGGNLEMIYLNLSRNIAAKKEMQSLESSQRIDFHADSRLRLHWVSSFEKHWQDSRFSFSWQPLAEASSYLVYQRSYPQGQYKLVDEVKEPYFKPEIASDPSLFGYVIIPKGDITGIHSEEVLNIKDQSLESWLSGEPTANELTLPKGMACSFEFVLEPGGTKIFSVARGIEDHRASTDSLYNSLREILSIDLDIFKDTNRELFARVPARKDWDRDTQWLYKSAWNMMRQVMMPAEGKANHNYYLFSREPTWGWGHGGQVFHESITMLAYAYLDPQAAMNSQRVFSERQYDNGYINYRTGPFLDEIIEYNGQLTSSAPWYNWLNWEIYMVTKDRRFLEEMYVSGKRFYDFYTKNRDSDRDGLLEWGGHAILESVRDANVAVWDEVGWPANFESVDLNCMMVMEAKSLEQMAMALGFESDAKKWQNDYQNRSRLINETFWDEANGFFYNVNKSDNSFTFKEPDDLKRDEIIGFLPLWAGVVDTERAEKLAAKLTDPSQFWRKNGIPSLSAQDSFYNDKGYWNGPVWLPWNYLVFRGLQDYGYWKEADELTDKITSVMISQLKQNHNLWEFYSPDADWAGYHKTYIWAGIINRMLMDRKTPYWR